MKKSDRTPEQRAVDRVVTQAMALHHASKKPTGWEAALRLSKMLMQACARLEKTRKRNRAYISPPLEKR